MRYLIVAFIIIFNYLNIYPQETTDNCTCSKILKAFIYAERKFINDSNYTFLPKKAVMVYEDGTESNPEINKHLKVLLSCTDVKIKKSGFKLYYIDVFTIEDLRKWLISNCSETYNKKYSKPKKKKRKERKVKEVKFKIKQ